MAATGVADRFPNTPLFAGLDKIEQAEDRGQFLQQRIEARYTPGQSSSGLREYLEAQGFKVTRYSKTSTAPGAPIYGRAEATGGSGSCKHVANVRWRADAAGVLRELKVSYGDSGCL